MTRIQSVDAFRVLAILAVIGLHTAANSSQAADTTFDGPTVVNNLERFAVPLFFILSGYFWAARCTGPRDYLIRAIALCQRVLLIFLAWSVIYLVLPEGDSYRDKGWLGHAKLFFHKDLMLDGAVMKALFEGPKVHLWFLPGLACAAAISGILLAANRPRLLATLAIVLFAVGLCGGAYANTPLGLHSLFNFRDGPFFGLIFFVTGYGLAKRPPQPSWLWIGVALAIGGALLQLAEAAWLHRYWGGRLMNDYVIATYPFGVGVALIALSNAPLLRVPGIAAIGPLVLGIYASQYLFVDLLRPFDDIYRGNVAWDLAYVAIVFAMSLAVAFGLSRFRITRSIVM